MDSKTLEQEIQEAARDNEVVRLLLNQRDEARFRVNLAARANGESPIYPIPERHRQLWSFIEAGLQPVTR